MMVKKKHSYWVAVIITVILGIGIVRELYVVQNPEKKISAHRTRSLTTQKPVLYSATLLPQPQPLPAFQLLNEQGIVVTEQSLKGQWHLLFFGYTGCPDICPATLGLLKPVMKALEPYQNTRFVFISIDSAQDTPETLKAFLSHYDLTFTGLTGDETVIAALLKSMHLYAAKENKEFVHSSTVLVLNPEGQWVALFSKPDTATNIIHDLEVLQGKKQL